MPSDPRAVTNLVRLLRMAMNDCEITLPMSLWLQVADRFTELCELEQISLTVTVVPGNGDPNPPDTDGVQ